MKAELNTSTLKNALKSLSKVNDASRILINVAGGIITLSKSNTETTVNVTIEGYSCENGIALLPAEIMSMIKNLREPYLTISDEILSCGRKTIRFNSENLARCTEEFYGNLVFSTTEKEFHRMLEIKYAVAKEEIRPILCGVAFAGNETCACDGYRIALREGEYESTLHETFVVNKNAIEILESILNPKSDEMVNVYVSDKLGSAKFEIGSTEVIGKIIPGEFINYRQIIPSEFRYVSELKVENLKEELDYIKSIKTDYLDLKFEEEQLTILTNQCKEELDPEASKLRTKQLQEEVHKEYVRKYNEWDSKKKQVEKKGKEYKTKAPNERIIKPQRVYRLVPLAEMKINIPCLTELNGEDEFNIAVNSGYLLNALSSYYGQVYMKMDTHVSPIIITKDDKNLDLILPIRVRV